MIKANNNFIKKAYLSLPIGQIHYRTNECSDGIPLILLHRTPSSSKMYEPMMRAMFNKGKQAAGGGTFTDDASEPWVGMSAVNVDPSTGEVQFE